MKKVAIFVILGILVVSIVGFVSLFYFDSTKDDSQSILSDCRSNANCILESLTNLSKTEDKETVLTTFSDIIKARQQTQCHRLAHHLGQFMYNYTENLDESLSLIDRTCGGALYHGVMQAYFATKSLSDNGTPTNVVASNACDELGGFFYSDIRTTCSHGVGHGLVIAYNYDALTAFEKCDVFEEVLNQRNCVAGVAMENAGIFSTPEDATVDEDDLLFPCSALDEESAIPCLNWHAFYVVRTLGGSVEDAFEECEKNENETIVKYCYYGIGITKSLMLNDNLDVILMCQKGNLNYQNYCFAGAAYGTANQIDVNQGSELCKLSPEIFQFDCYNTIGKWIHTMYFTEEEIENACSQIESEEYYQICVNANPEELGRI